ncbi:MAG: hypothetical protein NXH79_03475 [Rhodobacteraceae bacterium]|jgi:hypothetical protein|nr:hypothetical protein [Paracoccaceae bacterium]
MAIPLAPVAGIALRYGAVALTAYAVARALPQGRFDQSVDDAMDETPEGIALHRGDEQVNGAARWRRVLRVGGATGPGVEVDVTGLARIRVRRLR